MATTITAHCLIKNEENFIWYAVKSVIDHVDQIFIFDTGSTDKSIEIVKKLVDEYPTKIVFEERGECSGSKHTLYRQEMLTRTTTDWFMMLDGDEIWTKRGMEEVLQIINSKNKVGCLIAPYYLCVGDIFHHSIRGRYKYFFGPHLIFLQGQPRVFRITPDLAWNLGPYGQGDYVKDGQGEVSRYDNTVVLKNKYWHTSCLIRSSRDNDVLLGRHCQVLTYSLKLIGEGLLIKDQLPEVFQNQTDLALKRLPILVSWLNLLQMIFFKLKLVKSRYYDFGR